MDFGDDKIRWLISSTDAGWKNENEGVLSGVENWFKSTNGSFERRNLILSTKNELNRSADNVEVGSDKDELERWQIW